MGGGGGILSPVTDTLFGSPQQVATPDYTGAANQTAANNLAAARAATAANRVNQVTPYGSLNYTQSGTDQYGNPTWTATQTVAPELQGAVTNSLNQVANQYSTPFTGGNLPSYGINPGEDYTTAIMRRLAPTQEHQSQMSDQQLANQGIAPGTEAYNNAKRLLAQQQNDQLTSAVTGGMGVGLAANQQQFGQNLTNYQLPMTVASNLKSLATPSYVSAPTQATTAGADITGAMGLTNQSQQANANAINAQNNAAMSGLFSLAGAGIGKWG